LQNIPVGLQVYAPIFPAEGSGKAQLYSADGSGPGGGPLPGFSINNGLYQLLTANAGNASATWVVLAGDNTQFESLTFPLLIQNSGAGDPSQIRVSGSLAPVSDVGVANATAPIPRFRDFSVPQRLVNLRLTTSLKTGTTSTLPSHSVPHASGSIGAGVNVGSNVTVTISIINDTSDASQNATGVTIKDNLPSGLNLISCTATAGT
jgi:uncharacterized repeat protein (TIGR01451 family)